MCLCASLLLLAALPAFAGPRGGAALHVTNESPAFAQHQQTAFIAQVGDSAALRCKVLRLADRAVSWVRSSDLQILTHAGMVFTADSRVSSSDKDRSLDEPPDVLDTDDIITSEEDYTSVHTLRIERLRLSDSGRYECQINTEPKLSLFFNLTVIESSLPTVTVSVVGSAAPRGAVGGAARLACEARYASAAPLPPAALAALPPLHIEWTHAGETLDPQSARGGISLDTERWAGRSVSRLTLARLSRADAGRYACAARGAAAALRLRLYRAADGPAADDYDDYGDELTDGEMEMQRDQADARVSAATRSLSTVTLLAVTFLLRFST